jgi:hypothetical protein
VDDNGAVNPASILGQTNWILFKEIRTGLRMVFFSKTAISVPMFVEQLKIVKNYLEGIIFEDTPIRLCEAFQGCH